MNQFETAQLARLFREVIAGRYPRDKGSQTQVSGRQPRRIDFTLAEFAPSTSATGKEYSFSGLWLTLSSSSHASCALHVCFDNPATNDAEWYPIVPNGAIQKPDGTPFKRFFVRRQLLTPSNANPGIFIVDPNDHDARSIVEQPRAANVNPAGKADVTISATTLAGADVLVKAADTGELALAGWNGTAYRRVGVTDALRVLVNMIAGQDGVAAGAGVNGATVQRMTLATDDVARTDLDGILVAAAASKIDLDAILVQAALLGGTVTAARAAVNPIVGQAGVAAGAGATGATTQRVTLASDSRKVDQATAYAMTTALACAASVAILPALANQRVGYVTVRETAGAVASLRIFNGVSNAGALLWAGNLVANESDRNVLPDLDAAAGVYIEIISGSVDVGIATRVIS